MMSQEKRLYPKSIQEALAWQKVLASEVKLEDDLNLNPSCIAGMDVSCNRFDPQKYVYASCVLLSFPALEVIETVYQIEKQEFSYIPGLLGFREAPALMHAFEKLNQKPDLILVDGQGISHPRGLGIASHLGVLLDTPTIGVAKSLLVGAMEGHLGKEVGAIAPLVYKGKTIGCFLRSKKKCKPLIISTGHRVSLQTALKIVQKCFCGYRLPEPTRQAHLAANAARVVASK